MIRIFPALMAPSYVVCIPVFADRGPTPPGVAAPPEPRKLKSSTRAPRRAAGRAREPRVDQRREFADVPERLVPFARQSGMASKWWALDVVFGRPLTSRQERRLRLALRGGDDDWYAVLAGERRGPERRRWTRLRRRLGGMDGWGLTVGRDGVTCAPWPEKWPSPADGAVLLDALDALGVSYRWRAAPLGRDCSPETCDEPCHARYNGEACDPVWTAADWVEVA